jgi:hypothetical protein
MLFGAQKNKGKKDYLGKFELKLEINLEYESGELMGTFDLNKNRIQKYCGIAPFSNQLLHLDIRLSYPQL